MESPWERCGKCKGGCSECDYLGRVLKEGAEVCVKCEGFGTLSYANPDDPNDYDSFAETCSDCKGEGSVFR